MTTPAIDSTSATAAKPAQTMSPTRNDAACQLAIATSAAVTSAPAAICSQSTRASLARAPAGVHQGPGARRPGAATDGPAQQQERLDAADLEERHEREQQRDEQPDADALRDR